MKKTSATIERWISNRFPNLYLNLIQQPRNYFRFRTERNLCKGNQLSQSSHPSIIFFTTQKCASRYVDSIIHRLVTTAGMVHADYDAYVTMVKMPVEVRPFSSEANMRQAFQPQGYYYGPIGTYRGIPDLDQYRVVLQLRDPRDMLTSLYFSTVFSHAIINPKMIRRRKEALGMDIDRYVLHTAKDYLKIFGQYGNLLLGRKSVLFLRYEEMVSDFPNWLDRLSVHVNLGVKKHTLELIKKTADFSITKEDKFSHRRQIRPGDYLRKLRPETIRQLNERLEPILNLLGYTS